MEIWWSSNKKFFFWVTVYIDYNDCRFSARCMGPPSRAHCTCCSTVNNAYVNCPQMIENIGAGAIELAGARTPNFWQQGHGGAQQNLWGACKKNEKAKYSAKEVFSVSSLGNGHTATHQQLCRSHCVLCRRRQPLDTASVRRHPVSQSGKRNPESTPYFVVDWIQVWCTRVDGQKYLNTFQNC